MKKEVLQVATKSLDTFRVIVTEQNFKEMGFATAAEIKSATPGEPMPVYMVQLGDLRAYKSGDDPTRLLKNVDRAIVPISVNDQVRSSVTVEKGKEGWKSTGFGAPKLTRLLAKARQESSAATGAPIDSYFAVHVAALNRYFMGHQAGNRLRLTPIDDDTVAKLTAGKTLPAEEVFAALVPVARQYNDLPGGGPVR
jgi:hypothetical protein